MDDRKREKKLSKILECLNKNKPLSTIQNLDKHNGRWDLRGSKLSVSSPVKIIESRGYNTTLKSRTLKISNTELKDIDFSYCDLSYGEFDRLYLSNCLFIETKAKEMKIIASDFIDCSFINSNISYSHININIGDRAGSFINVCFDNTNLSECIFSFPLIKDCLFKDCNLKATNFDGSRFINTEFIGIVDSTWFKGYSTTARKSYLGIFNRFNPTHYLNKMENVDFSKAKLIGVSFSNYIDLSKCIFPNTNDYIVIKNLKKTMNIVRCIIELTWKGEYKRKGLAFIDNVYYKSDKYNQKMDIIDTFPVSTSDLDFDNNFFDLIRDNV